MSTKLKFSFTNYDDNVQKYCLFKFSNIDETKSRFKHKFKGGYCIYLIWSGKIKFNKNTCSGIPYFESVFHSP